MPKPRKSPAQAVPRGYVQLEKSERRTAANAELLGPADANERFSVTIVLRRRSDGPPVPAPEEFARTPVKSRRRPSEAEFAAKYGASVEDIAAITNFAAAAGLTVTETSAARRSVIVSGTVSQMEKAFGVTLHEYEVPLAPSRRPPRADEKTRPPVQRYRGREGFIHVPRDIAPLTIGIFGLDNRRIGNHNSADPPNTGLLDVPTVMGLYNFPPVSAAGQTIAVVSFGGPAMGYDTSTGTNNDFARYYSTLPSTFKAPTIITVPPAASSENDEPDVETTLDICISSTVAQGATIAVYFLTYFDSSPDQKAWYDLIERVITPLAGDLPAGVAAPSVISCSDYICDGDDSGTLMNEGVTTAFIDAVHMAFEDAMMHHITVCIGCGDQGSDSKVGSTTGIEDSGYQFGADGKAHVLYPASDPLVLSCGGTTVGNIKGRTFDEYVWNDSNPQNYAYATAATGGGVSDYFTQAAGTAPAYQSSLNPTSVNDNHVGRGVPDVAGNASAISGYPIYVGGTQWTASGTSAVAPLYAGLIAVINASLGTSVGFINPLIYQLDGSMCRDVNPAVGGGPANNSLNGIKGYTAGAGWDACTGWGSFDGIQLLNALAQVMQFWMEDSTFGADEVQDTPSYGDAFWLVLEGFTPNLLGITATQPMPSVTPTLSGAFLTLLGSSNIVLAGPPVLERPNDLYSAQRIRFAYNITFPAGVPFPTGNTPAFYELSASITVPGNPTPFTANTDFELVSGANPYFANTDPNQSNVFWLSQDLRVFAITPESNNTTPIGNVQFQFQRGSPTQLDTAAAYSYIQQLLGYFNQTYSDPGGMDPFSPSADVFPLGEGAGVYTGDSSVTPATPNPGNTKEPFNNYNFAIARVRLKGSPSGQAPNVKVFFRIFSTQTNDTDYVNTKAVSLADPYITYPSNPANDPDNPATPLPGTDVNGSINGCTLPFFADPNELDLEPATMANPDPPYGVNNQNITIPINRDYVWTYFGCFLNVYDPSYMVGGQTVQQWLAGGTHHCLVAQIAYSGAPIENMNGVIESPENSDKLAQRNLEINPSGNPGFPLTHRIPSTFDLRPSPLTTLKSTGYLLNYPDELMIDWGNTPVGAIASIYWPQVDADQVLALASQFYTTHLLSKVDAHTIQCNVPGGVTYVPIPTSTGQNFAGLFTVDLPSGIRVGNQFDIIVRRITSRQIPTRHLLKIGGRAAASELSNWRYVVGTFQVTVPVQRDETILPQDENLLAILKWRLTLISSTDRWYPVLLRYISYLEGRITGMGGNPSQILPSPLGTANQPIGQPVHRKVHHPEDEFTGKVEAVIYDRFGDYSGFVMRTEHGEERRFHGHEHEVEELVVHAWEDRIVISVGVGAGDPHWPAEIILRRTPWRDR
jgi:Pro-kumamolisin, activation domain